MGWANLPNNQVVTFENLKDACDYGYLLQLLPIPPQNTSIKKCIRAELIQSYVEIEPAPLVGTPSNQVVTKGKIVGKEYVYYQLQGCDSADGTAWTRLDPVVAGRRYYLPMYPNPKVYYYTGTYTPLQIAVPSGYNGSIQRSSQENPYETYCPS
jgi:hypothetical protein